MIPQQLWFGGTRFRFLNVEHEVVSAVDWNRAEWGKLWLYNLHYFDCLRQPDMTEETGNAWIMRWIAENPPGCGNGWEPYPLSLRIVNWIKRHLAGHPLNEAALNSLAVQIRFLRKRLERHLLANHYLANAKALVFAGMFFRGIEAGEWLATGCEIYRQQLPEQVLSDGGHFERSPMYHSIILEDLLDLANLGAPLFLDDTIVPMLRHLRIMTGPDGEIARLNDAANGIALCPQQLFDYAEKLGFARPPDVTASVDLPETGYARLVRDDWMLIADGAPIGPDYQPGHAHADTLSFELWHGKTRMLIDSGTGEYVDTPLRREQRGSAGHNTLRLDGRNSSEVWGAHRVARRAGIVERRFSDDCFAAAHDGYAPVIHRREWTFANGGIKIADRLSGSGRHTVEQFWHFPPEAALEVVTPERVAIRLAGKVFFLTHSPAWQTEMASGHFSPEFGRTLNAPVLILTQTMEFPGNIETSIGVYGR